MTVSAAYLNSCTSEQSQTRIEFELKRLAKLMHLTSVDDIDWHRFDRAAVVSLLSHPELKTRKATTQNFTLSVIKRLCEEAYFAQLLPVARYLSIKRIPNFRSIRCPPPFCVTKTEILKMLQLCRQDGSLKGIRDAAILAVGFGCGLRRSEIAKLPMDNIDFSNHLVRIIGKGNRERIIGLSDSVWNYLQQWLEQRGSTGTSYCFVPLAKGEKLITSRHLNDETIYLIVQTRSLTAIGRTITPHDLRRAFASHLLASNIDINTLRIVMGHSDISTTQIYDRRDELTRITAIAQIALLP